MRNIFNQVTRFNWLEQPTDHVQSMIEELDLVITATSTDKDIEDAAQKIERSAAKSLAFEGVSESLRRVRSNLAAAGAVYGAVSSLEEARTLVAQKLGGTFLIWDTALGFVVQRSGAPVRSAHAIYFGILSGRVVETHERGEFLAA